MANRRFYIVLVVVFAIGAVAAILLMRTGSPTVRGIAKIAGWGCIAMILVLRIAFGRRKAQPPAPTEK